MVPEQPFVAANAAAAHPDKNYLFDGLIASIHQHPLQWRLIITIGQPNDPTNDATIPWPDTREQVEAGTLTLDHVESEDGLEDLETGPCRDINVDPLVLPEEMAPSDDPLLSARSAVYSQSFTRRAGEKALPSAVTPSEVRNERGRGHRAAAIHRSHEVFSLAYRRNGADHARHWLSDGGIARLPIIVLVSIHRPLGILILIVVVIRYINRRFSTLPVSRRHALISARLPRRRAFLYALLFVQPLVGWGMLSAAKGLSRSRCTGRFTSSPYFPTA